MGVQREGPGIRMSGRAPFRILSGAVAAFSDGLPTPVWDRESWTRLFLLDS